MDFKPHNYQKYCIDRITHQDKVALWLECGLGKTIITLTSLMMLKYDYLSVNKILIIAPKKVAEATWQREIAKWEHLKLLRVSTVLGSKKQRLKALEADADIYIINRENVAWLVNYYGINWCFDTVVLDESSSFKNPKAVRVKKLSAVSSKINKMIQLTGTPTPKNALDAWSQIYLMDGGERLGKTYNICRDRYFTASKYFRTPNGMMKGTNYKFTSDLCRDSFYNKISDICISLKAEDYLDVPDMIEDDIPVVLSPKAQKQYNTLEKDLMLEVDAETLDVGSASALRNKLQQLGNGAAYNEDRDVIHIHDCKIEALMETIERIGEDQNILIFYRFQHDLTRLMEEFSKNKLTKDKVFKKFNGAEDEIAWNSGKINYMFAHPASCCYGLNIQEGGHHAIWFGLTDSLEQYQQACARLHRQGQKHKVFIHRLMVDNSVDYDIIQGLNMKEKGQEEMLQRMKARINKYKK